MSDLDTASTTRVFWDVDDFPVPHGRSVESFTRSIERALEVEGYIGEVHIQLYDAGKLPVKAMCHFRWSEMLFRYQAAKKYTRLHKMLLDMVEWAYENPPTESSIQVNLLVIAKDIPEADTEFFYVCKTLQERSFNVFLTVPDDCPPEEVPPPATASLVWRWTNLWDGSSAILSDSDSDSDE